MKIFSVKQILLLHEVVIKKHGGSFGVRDIKMLESAVFRPFATYSGEDLHSDIYSKAGALIQSVTENHPFIDGNKRTAFSSAFIFLKRNGIIITANKKQGIEFMLNVINKQLSVDEISSWLKKHSKKI